MATSIERRRLSLAAGKLEIRANGAGGKTLRGYAAVFDQLSEDMGFREIVKPGCFARALREKQDVRALINHESSLVLGRTASGTLRLQEDSTGLAVECDLPDTQAARDLAVSLKRGDISGMSFGFSTVSDRWGMQDKELVRDLMDVDLYDVSVVTYPAYPQTEAALRSLPESGQRFLEQQARELKAKNSHPLEDPAVARMVAEMGR